MGSSCLIRQRKVQNRTVFLSHQTVALDFSMFDGRENFFSRAFSEEDLSSSALASPLRISFSDEEESKIETGSYTSSNPRRSKRNMSTQSSNNSSSNQRLKFNEPLLNPTSRRLARLKFSNSGNIPSK